MAGMRFRKLRIAWSVMCGLVFVLLIVLWTQIESWQTLITIRYKPAGWRETYPNSGYFEHYDDVLEVPNLIPITIALACVFVPWIHWSKRFSLRTLLTATTLVAVALGLIVWALRE